MRQSDETPCGQTVFADGKAIGTIAALFISTLDWCVESLRIALRKDVADHVALLRTD